MALSTDLPANLEALKRISLKHYIDPSLNEHYKRSWACYYSLHVSQFFSIRIVWLLLKIGLKVKPNSISFLALITGLIASGLFLKPTLLSWLLGAFLFELSYILDTVDGQYARAIGASTPGGGFLDLWGNFIVAPAVIFCIGMNFLPSPSAPWISVLAGYTLLSVSLMPILSYFYFKKTSSKTSFASEPEPDRAKSKTNPLKFVYTLLYRSCTMPVIMNVVTMATLLTLLNIPSPIDDLGYLGIIPCYYATIGTAVWIIKGIHLSIQR